MQNLPELKTGRPRTEQGFLRPIPEIEIPFGLVEGAKPGPCLIVTAGVHASEYCSIEAAVRLMRTDPQKLRGTLLVLPILNVTGFRARSIYVMPEDGNNLNRMFPGRPDGSVSERLAHWLVTEVFPKADAYLDLHGGDMSESLTPFTIYPGGHAPSEALAAVFGLPIAVGSQSRGNTISAAGALGIPSVLVEIGCNGLWNEAEVTAMMDGIGRVMGHMQMIESASTPAAAPRLMTMTVPLAPASGLWYSAKRLSDPIAAGEKLGEIRDVFGTVLATIVAEKPGEVLYQLTTLAVNAGEALVGIGIPVETTA
ncbi:M14 family metallopeptidase [Rhizobium lusitanum]|uniref:M14 family metallopeptidase n=1 Tax=Rhizobium lusitanum TaxID=293958 RepID=UPI00195C22E6|nr:M14 family metallopeptidase [Rhizobium lusitanum]MBM7047162.1 succinylglutamate desuccinylase/aspartoacylase family protein [Rhizobium lusitanum]